MNQHNLFIKLYWTRDYLLSSSIHRQPRPLFLRPPIHIRRLTSGQLSAAADSKSSTWVYRCLKPGLSPPYLHDFFQPIQKQYQHHTQLSKNGIIIPRAHMNMMSWSFRYKGAVVWNSLPDDIKGVNRGSTFSHVLKLFYTSSCNYCTILAYCV